MRPYEELIVDIPNYPKPGVVFKDLTPAFADADAFRRHGRRSGGPFRRSRHYQGGGRRGPRVHRGRGRGAAAGSRVRSPVASRASCRVRVLRESYALEYGTDVLEIHADALTSDDVVLIVDDLVATGGTTTAMVRLVAQAARVWRASASVMESRLSEPSPRCHRRRPTDVLAGRQSSSRPDGRLDSHPKNSRLISRLQHK